jgi:hypothetical protein
LISLRELFFRDDLDLLPEILERLLDVLPSAIDHIFFGSRVNVRIDSAHHVLLLLMTANRFAEGIPHPEKPV